jgi:hypothetical protein
MATWGDVRRVALDLPGTEEKQTQMGLQWRVKSGMLAWERPLRRADFQSLGESAPEGEILAVWVEDLGVKEALLSDDPEVE